MVKQDSIEIIVKQGSKAFKVTMSGEAAEDVEEIKKKLGVENILQAIIYSIKVLSEGFEMEKGSHEIPIGEKKLKLTIDYYQCDVDRFYTMKTERRNN